MKYFCVRISLMLTAGLLLPTQAASQESPILWGKQFSVQGTNYNGQALAATPNGIYVGGVAVDTSVQSKSFIWIWKLNSQGERLFESRIEFSVAAQGESGQPKVISVEPALSGEIYALIQNNVGNYLLLQLDQSGKEVSKWPLVFTERGVCLTKMIKVGKEDFMLIGSAKSDAFVTKINRQGKVSWAKVQTSANLEQYGSTGISTYIDVSVSDKGQIWLLRNTGTQQQFYMGKGVLELEVISLTGETNGGGMSISGRNGSLLLGGNGLLTILYDKAHDQGKDIWLGKLNNSGTLLWDISIFKEPQNLGSFMAVSLESDDGYIVAGTDYLNLLELTYINEAGKVTHRYQPDRPTEASWRTLALAREGKDIFLLTTIFAEGKALVPSTGVSILKLKNDTH